jgi:RNA polymerase sigma-70 factor (sigma-E family)
VTADEDFDAFAVAAWPRLHRSAYLLTGDHHLAEDLAQTALARTYGSWRRVRRADALAYARRVLVNANIDRARRRRSHEVTGGAVDAALATRAQEGAVAEDVVGDRDELVRLLSGLTDRERRVVVLRHYFDLSEAEVARELRIAPGTVKSTLSRALRKLRVAEAPGVEDEHFVKGDLR